MKTALACLALSVTLAGCGTGNLPPASQATPVLTASAGIYKGSLSTHQNLLLAMFYDGTAYLFYLPAGAQRTIDDVVVVRNGTQTDAGKFSGVQGTRYRFASPGDATPVQVAIDFTHSPAVSGSVAAGGDAERTTFTASPAQMLGQASTRAATIGLYSGNARSLQGTAAAQLTVTASGLLAGTIAGGCEFRGTLTPRSDLNAYDVSVTFGAAPCIDANATLSGSAVLDEAQLLVALPRRDRDDVFVFAGTR
ncbi:MAG TPA: hypothetical protein VNE00_05420 [Paraburkholderia sp.]|jgi:hypothetical protein|nr:hypothetical protein [Paraburkholderia sp.]